METNKVPTTEERISHFADQSIHLCFPANISEPDNSSISDETKVFSPSIPSFFPATISSDSDDRTSVILDELSLQQFCPSIQSIFPAATTSTQTNSPATNDEINIIPYHHPIESCFPPRCDSDDDDSFVSSGINIINRYLRSFSIQSYFPPRKSSSGTSVCDHPSPSPPPRPNDSNSISILEKPNLKVFTFTDLKSATKNFKSDTSLGNGAFGKVFKGCMDEKRLSISPSNKVGTGKSTMLVAIKKLSSKTMQGFQEWQQSEVNFLGSLSHPNLVKLLGYCWEDKDLFLVYEFMKKGSLHNHLFRRNNCEPLSWDMRLKIAIEAARGLAFLNSLDKQEIHRYVKASNILLDGNFNAKIFSDFGLTRLGPSMYGYAAPEYISIGHLYVKSDVYAFGVVLLEMLTGLRELDTEGPSWQKKLVDWLKPCLSNERQLKTIMDVKMEGQYSSKAALQAAQLTLKCLELDPTNRPSMKDVVEVLEHIQPIKEKPTKINSTHDHSIAQQPAIHHHSPLHVDPF